jgi:Flp pilus assembly protein TadD/Zn-dependent protease with chaperone function
MIGHLTACTLTGLAALAAVYALRQQSARWRHIILLAALLRFAVPTGWLIGAGERVPHAALGLRAGSLAAAEDLTRLLRGPWGTPLNLRVPLGSNLSVGPVAIWGAGFALFAGVWAWRWRAKPAAVRMPFVCETEAFAGGLKRIQSPRAVELRIVAADRVPGACGLWHACVVVPDGLSAELEPSELEAVLAHELAHVARRDNLAAGIAHAIAIVFWFHPLVWWMERRMLEERENAADELVLRSGARVEDYAAGILKTCRMAFGAAAGYAGVNGLNLSRRMERIMFGKFDRFSSGIPRTVLGGLAGFAVLVPLLTGFLAAQDTAAPQPGPARQEPTLEQAQAASAAHPERVDLLLAVGNVAVRSGKYALGLDAFQKALERVGDDSKQAGDIELRLGETYRRMGKSEVAVSHLRRAKELLPDNDVTASTLALVLDSMGKVEEATREYRAVLARNPKNGVAMNNLAFLLVQNGGSLDEALTLAQDAQQLLPNLAEVRDTVGWIYLKKGLTDDAIAVFDEIVQKRPDSSTFHFHLGMALAQKGDRFGAATQLNEALRCHPPEEEAGEIRELLAKIGQ